LLGDLKPGSLSADNAYDTDAILADNGIAAVIPPRSHRIVQRPFDKHQYKNRNLVERFFCRIKQFRRIATRYDKLAERFASFVVLTPLSYGLLDCRQTLARITASFGAATFPDHGRIAAALIQAADKALYDAKNAGRNQVITARLLN
jgi:GGDEF domain-containing protein